MERYSCKKLNFNKNLIFLLLISQVFIDVTSAQVPSFVWAKKTNEVNPSWINAARDIVADADGHIYVTGNYGDSLVLEGNIKLAAGTGSFIAKLDANGTALWAVNANSYGNLTPLNINISPGRLFILVWQIY